MTDNDVENKFSHSESEPPRDSARAAALTVGGPSVLDEGSQQSIPMRTRVGIAALVLASILLIVAGVFLMFGGASGGASSSAGSSLAVASASADDGGSAAESGSPASSEGGSSAPADGKTVASNDGSTSSTTDSLLRDGGSSTTDGSAPSSSRQDASPAPSPEPAEQPSQTPSDRITVSVSISSSAVGGSVSGGGTFTFNQGATAYDALCACGLSVNARGSQYGLYVSAIGGLAEKEHGGKSGWVYSVNGVSPMTSCANYVLSDGDVVSWFYVTGN